MCGKFTQYSTWEQVHAFTQPLVAAGRPEDIVVATPMRFARIMRLRATGERELADMRWGFAGKGDVMPTRPKHMHARSETIDKLPTFAQAFATARGILMVHTFNEGEELPSGKTKQWVVTPKDGQPLALAVVCEVWHNGPETLETFVQVTVPANALIGRITDRMPAILPREAWPLWLGETEAPLAEVKSLLRTHEDSGAWDMAEQAPARRSATRAKPAKSDTQRELF